MNKELNMYLEMALNIDVVYFYKKKKAEKALDEMKDRLHHKIKKIPSGAGPIWIIVKKRSFG